MLITPRRTAAGVALAVALGALAGGPAAAAPGLGSDTVGGPALASTGIVVAPGTGAEPLPSIAAKSWVLADLTTGEVLAAKNPHRLGRPASTLKTLTAATLLPVLDKDAQHTVTYKEASAEGGHVGIVPGSPYSVWDLWHGLLLPSGNDAAAALAGANGGMARTVAQMQANAARLQALDTTVRNPSGLDADGQYTSAYDLALIARAAMAEPDFRTLTRTVRYDFPGRNPKAADKKRKTYKIYTQNRLLLRGYKGTVAGKTGYTTKAGRTFWAAATRGGHTLVVTLLQIRQPTETAAESLLSWGFRNVDAVTPVGTLVDPLPEGGAPAPQESAPAPVGSAVAVGATTGPAATAPGAGVPLWVWLAVLVVLVGAAVAVVVGRGRRSRRGPDDLPAAAAGGSAPPASAGIVGATVLPTRSAAAHTSPSVVVRTPGRPADAVDPVVAAPPLDAAHQPSGATAVDPAPPTELDATAPVPVVTAPVAPAAIADPHAPDDTPASGSDAADDAGRTDVAAGPEAIERAAPAPVQPGGNVRVIRPPGPGSA